MLNEERGFVIRVVGAPLIKTLTNSNTLCFMQEHKYSLYQFRAHVDVLYI